MIQAALRTTLEASFGYELTGLLSFFHLAGL
jgi:hypothetical protein